MTPDPGMMEAGSAALLARLCLAHPERLTPPAKPHLRVRGLVRHAAALSDLPLADVVGSRKRPFADVRRAVALVAVEAGHSLSAIAAAVGRRDHSTVHHWRETGLAKARRDALFAHFVERLHCAAECAPWGPDGWWQADDPDTPQTAEAGAEADEGAEDNAESEAAEDRAMHIHRVRMEAASARLLTALRHEFPERCEREAA